MREVSLDLEGDLVWSGEVEMQRTWCNMAFLSSSSSAITSGLYFILFYLFPNVWFALLTFICNMHLWEQDKRARKASWVRSDACTFNSDLVQLVFRPFRRSFALVTFGRSRPLLLCQHKGVRCSAFYGQSPRWGWAKSRLFQERSNTKDLRGEIVKREALFSLDWMQWGD